MILMRGLVARACAKIGAQKSAKETGELSLEVQIVHHVVDSEAIDPIVEASVPIRVDQGDEQILEIALRL